MQIPRFQLVFRGVCRILVALSLVCCGEAVRSSNGLTAQDSSGVAIAVSSTAAWAEDERWTLADRPSLVLGEEGTGEPLWRIWGCVRAPDGSIALLSVGTSEVIVFDADGRRIRSFGRRGQGPGEFASSRDIALAPPDTVLVLDNDAIEIYLLDGTFVESHPIRPMQATLPDGRRASPMMLAPNRSILARVSARRTSPPVGMQRRDQALAVLPWGGQSLVPLGSYPALEQQRLEGNMGGNVVPPFARRSVWAVGASPEAQFLAADNDKYEIHIFDGQGSLRRIVRREYEPTAVKNAWVEDWKEEQREAEWTRRRPADHERVWAQMRVHETLQAFVMIAADTEGNIWVLRPNPEGNRFFDVFDPEGKYLGEVSIPAGFSEIRPFIDDGHFIGVWTDSLDVETVRVYELKRGL